MALKKIGDHYVNTSAIASISPHEKDKDGKTTKSLVVVPGHSFVVEGDPDAVRDAVEKAKDGE